MISSALLIYLSNPSGPLVKHFSDGSTVYVSYISDDPTTHSWRPNGDLTGPFQAKNSDWILHPKLPKGYLAVLVTLSLKHVPRDFQSSNGSSWAWQPSVGPIDPTYLKHFGILTMPVKGSRSEWFCPRFIRQPANGKPLEITFEVADTKWHTVQVARFRKGRKMSGGRFVGSPSRVLGGKAMGFPFQITSRWAREDCRVLAFDRSGNLRVPAGDIHMPGHPLFKFFDGPADDVATVILQVRHLKRVRFKGIHSRPNQPA